MGKKNDEKGGRGKVWEKLETKRGEGSRVVEEELGGKNVERGEEIQVGG